MKNQLALSRIFTLVLLVLEAMPGGAVLIFKSPDTEEKRTLFSYFDPTTYGYANFGPFLTAILTSLLALFLVWLIFKDAKWLRYLAAGACALAIITSVMPIFFGLDYLTPIGICISIILICNGALIFPYALGSDEKSN